VRRWEFITVVDSAAAASALSPRAAASNAAVVAWFPTAPSESRSR
jgi:hypothetical protein